jgi:hypothetical protein
MDVQQVGQSINERRLSVVGVNALREAAVFVPDRFALSTCH